MELEGFETAAALAGMCWIGLIAVGAVESLTPVLVMGLTLCILWGSLKASF